MIQTISFRGDRSPVPPRVKIGFESDNLVESLAFELPELADDQSAMLMISGNAYANMIDLHRTEDGKWAVDLTAEMVGPAGMYESYVAITCPDGRRWNSGVFDLLTGDLPDVSGAIETLYPTAVEHVLQEMAETRQEMAASVTASEDAAQRAEDAAQRAENAANQGGGGEAPAKDAVLYTAQELTEEQKTQARENIGAQRAGEYVTSETDPTVPEWAKQPSKPTYTAKEVGALPESTAIPEPYVLPAASADTLGGVRIGERLNVDKDGTVNADLSGYYTSAETDTAIKTATADGKWELIEETRLAETVESFTRNEEPDGTPYNYKAIVIRANFSEVTVDYSESTYSVCANDYNIYCFKASAKINTKMSIWGCIDVSGNTPVVNCCVCGNGGASLVDNFNGLINTTYKDTNYQSKPIKDISLLGTLPEGVTISIKGVRA